MQKPMFKHFVFLNMQDHLLSLEMKVCNVKVNMYNVKSCWKFECWNNQIMKMRHLEKIVMTIFSTSCVEVVI